MKKFIFIIIFSTLYLVNCEKNLNSPIIELAKPVLLSTPADTLINEAGIDAIPEKDAIEINWLLNPEFHTFQLYRKASKDSVFKLLSEFTQKDSNYVDEDILLNERYYYFLIGIDQQNRKSEPSDTLDYQLVEKAFNLFTSLPQVIFHWQISNFFYDSYIIKLFNDNQQLIWMKQIDSPHQPFNSDSTAKISKLVSGKRYKWRVDIVGTEIHSGSESDWKFFLMP